MILSRIPFNRRFRTAGAPTRSRGRVRNPVVSLAVASLVAAVGFASQPVLAGAASVVWAPWNPALGQKDEQDCTTINPIQGEYGVDVALPSGTPVYAPEPGTILQYTASSNEWEPGRLLEKLDSGAVVGFGHVNDVVSPGPAHVGGGEEIATVGNNATNSHVEFMYSSSGRHAVRSDFCPPNPKTKLATYMSGVAPSQTSAGGPGVAVDSAGTQLIFSRGSTGHLMEAWFTGVWNGPVDESTAPGMQWNGLANLASAPAVATTTGTQIVFWQGANGHIWEAWYASGRWNGPVDNNWSAASAPSVTVDSAGTQLVFWRAANGHLMEAWFTGAWNGPVDQSNGIGMAWNSLANLVSSPAVAVTTGTQVVFWQGANGHIWEAWYASGRWNGPVDNNWSAASAPGVTVDSAGTQLVFWRAANGDLMEAWFTGVWNGPVDQSYGRGMSWVNPASLASAPTVATTTGTQIVFWQGADGAIWEAWNVSGTWNGPVSRYSV